MAAELIAYPAGPLQKVRVISGETEETEVVFDENLPREIYERRMPHGIGPVILGRENQRILIPQCAMELDDARTAGMSDVGLGPYNLVAEVSNLIGRAFKKGVPVGGEDVRTRENSEPVSAKTQEAKCDRETAFV